jgi:hypothetical protein
MAKRNETRLEDRLVLHGWMNALFGYADTREVLTDLEKAAEGFDAAGRSYVLERLLSRGGKLQLGEADLERYDANVRDHLAAINRRRPEPITLRYFQHLAALYAEVFLDRRANDPQGLAADLNAQAVRLNEPVVRFEPGDLDKLAFWMATGAGKTLLMHLNYRQFLHYEKQPPDNILLITPNAGLTAQHLEEMRKSGIPCERFAAAESGLGLSEENVVRVLEITKLTGNKKGAGESVDVASFEGRSLILVDEGHKGAGGGKDSNLDKAWRPLRERLAEKGFAFEYSATFGQAVQASSKSEELAEEYGRAILFDYSYRHFYEDGYGKDFRILNLKNQTDEYTDLLLLGNLLSFYEQRRYFGENRDALKPYKLEHPLWVFVGSNVNKAEQSDIVTVVRFLHRFLKDEGGWAVETVEKLLSGETGLQDGDGRDVFAAYYKYLKAKGASARDHYEGVLREVFHAEAGGALRVADIKGSDGELGLKVSGAEPYFGLIYIGDTGAFKKLLAAEEVVVEEHAFTRSLFADVDGADSRINVLVGAKKFIEGWSSWRVSNMGLLNIGKSEGSQIIQLFGRGVRLKGLDFSLKRSSFVGSPADHPEHIGLLETLDIFAVQANYMAEFRRYLVREGVDPDGYEEVPLPIHREEAFLDEGLLYPKVPDGREFAGSVRMVLDESEDVRVNLDLSVRAESTRMGGNGVSTVASKAGAGRLIEEPYLSMLDWPAIRLDLLEHKEAKGLRNLIIPPEAPRRIIEKRDPPVYNLVADDALFEPKSFAGLAEIEEAVRAIVRKYAERFYGVRQQRWESENMVLETLTGDHPNFADYAVKIRASEEALIEEVKSLAEEVDGAHAEGAAGSLPHVSFDRHLYQPLLKDRGDEIKVSPPGLEESEERFVAALRSYCKSGGLPAGQKLFLLRNLSRGKGVGFFDTAGFYPDFILWAKGTDGSQKVVFVEPHGMRNDDPPPCNAKVDLYLALRDLSDRLALRGGRDVFLDSYVVSATTFHELNKKWGGGWTRERFAKRHVLFEDDLEANIPALLAPRDELERKISTSYPTPLASGYGALTRVGDPRDLYREQLRFAENVLAFLGSASLALLKGEDREKAGVDLKRYWSGGISPGDWKEMVQRCSKVFASYGDAPPATAIHRLKIGSESKGFGRDVIDLIRAKNDYKHDRGPKDLEGLANAADGAQEKLRRCMEALAPLVGYPLRLMKKAEVNPDGEGFLARSSRYTGATPDLPTEEAVLRNKPREGELYLDPGDGGWVSLYPFIVPAACLNREGTETYFVDGWDTKKGTARMKSFESGGTVHSREVAEALEGWADG